MNKNLDIYETLLVTGGAGFIGSNFVLNWLEKYPGKIINLDLLAYSGNMMNLASLKDDRRHIFIKGNIGDRELVKGLLEKHQPDAVINFAAESHVDRSIAGPEVFVETNVVGTFRLLDESYRYWVTTPENNKKKFRFLHVSTDEVYGSLEINDPKFTELKLYEPNSPYSASKAASDHFVRAYHHTYGLPVLTTNCSNNYGPYQYPEKLIPLVIANCLEWKSLPIYGDGMNIRDWLYVSDHCDAIFTTLLNGTPGETYNIGGDNEITNLELVKTICKMLDEMAPSSNGRYEELITFVADRPGHDQRYAIDTTKIENDLAWQPKESFQTGIKKTIEWYLSNNEWVGAVKDGSYQDWISANYDVR